jgi:creatinine amidohydrolase
LKGAGAHGAVHSRAFGFNGYALSLLVLLALLASVPPVARATDSVHLEDLTWTELKGRLSAGKTTVLLPIGGTEQNGPHMALGKHNVRVNALADRIARRLGDATVAPVIGYVPEGRLDPPEGHLRWPGTITVPRSVFRAVLDSAARSFKAHGFRTVVLLGDHGGYQADLQLVADKLNREWNGSPRVIALREYYDAAQTGFSDLLRKKGFSEREIGSHAGLNDVSMMLAIDPGLVRTDSMRKKPPATSAQGVDGDPRRSSAELGQLGVDLVVTRSVEAIRRRRAP